MYKRIVPLVLLLAGCATPFGHGGRNAVDEAMKAQSAAGAAADEVEHVADILREDGEIRLERAIEIVSSLRES
mgnify:CR=1 FL=1